MLDLSAALKALHPAKCSSLDISSSLISFPLVKFAPPLHRLHYRKGIMDREKKRGGRVRQRETPPPHTHTLHLFNGSASFHPSIHSSCWRKQLHERPSSFNHNTSQMWHQPPSAVHLTAAGPGIYSKKSDQFHPERRCEGGWSAFT